MQWRSLVALFVAVTLLIAVAVFFLFRESFSFRSKLSSLPILGEMLPESVGSSTWPAQPRYDMQEVRLPDGPGVLVTMQGRFLEPLFYQDELLQGKFVISGDLNQTPLLVFFTGQGNTFLTGFRSSTSQIDWSYVPTDEVLQKVQPNQEVELRFTLYEGTAIGDRMIPELRKLVRDDKIEPNEYLLTPDMIDTGVPRES